MDLHDNSVRSGNSYDLSALARAPDRELVLLSRKLHKNFVLMIVFHDTCFEHLVTYITNHELVV